MCAISAIPTTRLSNQFIALRMLSQVETDQRTLLKIQDQISSGRRFNLPSDDAPAASRAMTLQSILERKATVVETLKSTQTHLGASDSAIGTISSLLNDARSTALSAVGTAISPDERTAAVAQINSIIDQLVNVGNQKLNGRYLFGGAVTDQPPFEKIEGGVIYRGDSAAQLVYTDVNELTAANITGDSAFGAISQAVVGTNDLNPNVSLDTLLSDLHGGAGIGVGSIAVSDGTNTSIISLAGARTVGDVTRLLEANPPTGRTVTARVTSNGLQVTLNGGNLSISEVGGGTIAAELGIKRLSGVGPGPIVGADLNPALKRSTPLSQVLGSQAQAYFPNVGSRNDLVVCAVHSGTAYNGATIKYVDDSWFQATPGLTAGNEFAVYHTTAVAATTVLKFVGKAGLDNGLQLTATTAGTAFNNVSVTLDVRTVDGLGPQFAYNSTTKGYTVSVEAGTTLTQLRDAINASGGPFSAAVTPLGNASYVLATSDTLVNAGNTYATGDDPNTLSVHIASGSTTANQAIAAINAEGTFHAAVDPSELQNDGNGFVVDSAIDPGSLVAAASGTGVDFDPAGLQIVNGGKTYVIDLAPAVTIEDALNIINGSGAGVVAAINEAGTGVNIRSRLSGSDFSIGENGGVTASQLGIRSLTSATTLADLNSGDGVRQSSTGDDFTITRRDGTTFGVRLAAGVEASARIGGTAPNSALLVTAVAPGTAGNQYSVRITDSGSGGGNAVSLVGNTLTFNVDVAAGFTAQNAISLLSSNVTLNGQFAVRLDRSADPTNSGTGNLTATTAVSLTNGSGPVRTVGDVLNLVNNDPDNLASGPSVTARLAQFGNGIELYNTAPPSTSALKIAQASGSSAAADLGLLSPGETSRTSASLSNTTLTGTDPNRQQVDGLFTALIRLRDAIGSADNSGLQKAVDQLDRAATTVSLSRAKLGTTMNALETVQSRIDNETISLKATLSVEIDVDFAEAISELAQRQASFQAALQVTAQLSKTTLLDYL